MENKVEIIKGGKIINPKDTEIDKYNQKIEKIQNTANVVNEAGDQINRAIGAVDKISGDIARSREARGKAEAKNFKTMADYINNSEEINKNYISQSRMISKAEDLIDEGIKSGNLDFIAKGVDLGKSAVNAKLREKPEEEYDEDDLEF